MTTNYLVHGFLIHHGIKGQKWGVRRYQNPDGTLTNAGRIHYGAAEYDAKTKANFEKNRYSEDVATRKQAKQEYYSNKAAKLLMRGGVSEKYSYNVSHGAKKTSEFVKRYAESYVKDFTELTAYGTGAAVVGTLLAGPTGAYTATELTVRGAALAKRISRINRSGHY